MWSLLGIRQRQIFSGIPNIQVNNTDIEHVNEYKYVGVYFDVHRDWI